MLVSLTLFNLTLHEFLPHKPPYVKKSHEHFHKLIKLDFFQHLAQFPPPPHPPPAQLDAANTNQTFNLSWGGRELLDK